MKSIPRTTIEFIEVTKDPESIRCHKAGEVRINGVPVLVKGGTVSLDFNSIDLTEVTLTILPSEVNFRSALPYEPTPWPVAAVTAARQALLEAADEMPIETLHGADAASVWLRYYAQDKYPD